MHKIADFNEIEKGCLLNNNPSLIKMSRKNIYMLYRRK